MREPCAQSSRDLSKRSIPFHADSLGQSFFVTHLLLPSVEYACFSSATVFFFLLFRVKRLCSTCMMLLLVIAVDILY